jgi:putative transposase
MQRVTVTHTHRWHAHHRTIGEGPLYQGRFKSFPVEQDAHFLTVCRYVEANALRARLVKQAENWRGCSLSAREHRASAMHARLAKWPVEKPRNWLTLVNRSIAEEPLREVRRRPSSRSMQLDRIPTPPVRPPDGSPAWISLIIVR